MLTSLLVAVGLCLGLIPLVRRVCKEAARRKFQWVADVAQSGVPPLTLNFARRYELLPKAQAVVRELVYT